MTELNIMQVAQQLGVNEYSVLSWVEEGGLTPVEGKPGLWFTPEEVERFAAVLTNRTTESRDSLQSFKKLY
ncbi:MerR family transcriptional regulator [Rothia endophytica]|uniref:HTH merR-type domain-containing protein n=1 Tax=Rothia endophytica TaxID=1324766 RepID=A0ABP9BLY9_9MICC|nr:Uncharacterised protein [Mycobacteroides abscessus subsp. bolletii]